MKDHFNAGGCVETVVKKRGGRYRSPPVARVQVEAHVQLCSKIATECEQHQNDAMLDAGFVNEETNPRSVVEYKPRCIQTT